MAFNFSQGIYIYLCYAAFSRLRFVFFFCHWITFYYWCSELDMNTNLLWISSNLPGRTERIMAYKQFHVSTFISFHLTKGFSKILIAIKGKNLYLRQLVGWLFFFCSSLFKHTKSNHKRISRVWHIYRIPTLRERDKRSF